MMDFDLFPVKWARFYQPPAGLPINSRKSLSLSMQSNLSRPIKLIQQPISNSSLHQSNGLFLLVLRSTCLEKMSWVLNVSTTTRILPYALTRCAVLYSALEGSALDLYKGFGSTPTLIPWKGTIRSTYYCLPKGPLLLILQDTASSSRSGVLIPDHLMETFLEIFLWEPPLKSGCFPCTLNFGYC